MLGIRFGSRVRESGHVADSGLDPRIFGLKRGKDKIKQDATAAIENLQRGDSGIGARR